MTFNDIFKSNFLENVASVTILDMVLALVLAFMVGVFIFLVYKKTFKGVMYSGSFGVTLIALTMITTLVILAVTSNIVLSLGMVGALSIVRFRTAIKEPLDIAFLFWSIAAGIVLAAGLIPLAVFGSVVIGIVLIVFTSKNSYDNPFIMVIKLNSPAVESEVDTLLKHAVKNSSIKSKTVTNHLVELNYDVRLKNNDTSFVNTLAQRDGVDDVILVSYNGEYAG
ncbi:MAG TPA: DUF4956 domain-containing protein [Candidatus Dorea intestinavium]|nr:DUF4956 domain-containing protein [Candidatus Dorea intestinavium]